MNDSSKALTAGKQKSKIEGEKVRKSWLCQFAKIKHFGHYQLPLSKSII